jgi:general secretion pathway protein N
MTAASARLLRAVLIAIAVWSVLVWVLAQAGLGARYSLHPLDAEQIEALPQPSLSRAESTLRPFADYASVGERPLFNPDRRPAPRTEDGAPEPEPVPEQVELDVVLTSVVLAGDRRIAMVAQRDGGNPQAVRVGESLVGEQSSWRLQELAPRHAVFEGPRGRSRVDLRVFDGTGGQAPTPTPATMADEVSPSAEADPDAEQSPESRAEMIRRRIEERRRQMREEAARANQERGQ